MAPRYLRLLVGEPARRVKNYWLVGSKFEEWSTDGADWKVHVELDSIGRAIDRAASIERWIGIAEEREALFRMSPDESDNPDAK